MCKHCDELTNKVANLEVISTTPTKASKKKSSIFNMPKKDASTSCIDLRLDSPLCNQICVEKVVVDTCTQEVVKENEQLKQRSSSPHQGLDSSERQGEASPTSSR